MKRLIILFAIMVFLAGGAYFAKEYAGDKGNTSIDTSDRKFAFDDKDDIAKIIINRADKKVNTFTNKKGRWYINDYLVADYKINLLLNAITKIRVENLPPKTGHQTIFKSIKENGINVQVYNKSGKKVRAYDIGPDATNDRCTYLVLEGFKQPYCMNISGFGSLRSRFNQDVALWRDVAIYRLAEDEIASVKMEYNKDYTSSFEITNEGGKVSVIDIGGKTKGQQINEAKVKSYLSAFRELNGEGYDNDYILRDSINTLLPFATVTVQETNGKVKSMKLFPMAEMIDPEDESFDAEDALRLEKYFVEISNGDFMVAQQKLLKPIMRPNSYFWE